MGGKSGKGAMRAKNYERICWALLSVRWALLPVCTGERNAETGRSAHFTAEEVKEIKEDKEVARFHACLPLTPVRFHLAAA